MAKPRLFDLGDEADSLLVALSKARDQKMVSVLRQLLHGKVLSPIPQQLLDRLASETGRPPLEILEQAFLAYAHTFSTHQQRTLRSAFRTAKPSKAKPRSRKAKPRRSAR